MKYVFFIAVFAATLLSCNQATVEPTSVSEDGTQFYGAEITPENALASNDFKGAFDASEGDSIRTKVNGDVATVCKKKGCWMTMNIGGEDELFIKFKDYDYFVPLNCEGKNATIEGWAYKEEMSVEELQHYAFDEGKTEEEIAEITEPEVSYSFMADGVILK